MWLAACGSMALICARSSGPALGCGEPVSGGRLLSCGAGGTWAATETGGGACATETSPAGVGAVAVAGPTSEPPPTAAKRRFVATCVVAFPAGAFTLVSPADVLGGDDVCVTALAGD